MKAQTVCTCEIRRSKMSRKVSPKVAYAIVRAGGRQEKVSVGDKITLDRVAGKPGSTIELPVLLLVDGDKITADAKSLASAKVTAEKIEDLRGPKIVIQKYKNKTGYVGRGGDDTLFALAAGTVEFGTRKGRKVVNILAAAE